MPSVFDSPLAQLLLAQQAGAGQQGNTPAAPAPPARRSGLEQPFTGPADPRLSPEENERIRKSALLRAGATGLLATGNLQKGGLLSVIGQSAIAGQRLASDEAAAILESRSEPGEPQTQVITRPDGSMDLINKLTGATIANLGKPPKLSEERAEPKAVRLLNGQVVLASWDPKKGAYVGLDGQLLVGAIPTQERPRGTKLDFLADDGKVYTAFFDPETGQQIGQARLAANQPKADDGVSAKQIKSAADAIPFRQNFNVMKAFLEKRIAANPDNPLKGIRLDRLRFEQTGVFTVPLSFRSKLTPETQAFLNGMGIFMLLKANEIAGVRGITQEQARAAVFRDFGFEEGDSVNNIRNTLSTMEAEIVSKELIAGPKALEMLRQNMGIDGAQFIGITGNPIVDSLNGGGQ